MGHAASARTGWHTQNGAEAPMACGSRKRKRPTENGWALNSGGAFHCKIMPSIYANELHTV
ncbi:hypothetical protein AGMMS50225_06850 [Betaproteobacteria bacterium]|nr:hypothetical protein AGMMS50225_06850 [Betaproteobacteria bacterium]